MDDWTAELAIIASNGKKKISSFSRENMTGQKRSPLFYILVLKIRISSYDNKLN